MHSAWTKRGSRLDNLSVQALLDAGVDISGEEPQPIDPQLMSAVDLVVTLGREAHIEPIDGVAVENWDTVEPSERGIDRIERMELFRDDIAARVAKPAERLLGIPVPEGRHATDIGSPP